MKTTYEILNSVYDFCKIREKEQWDELLEKNIEPERFKFLTNYISELGIPFNVDKWAYSYKGTFWDYEYNFRNIVMPGESNVYFMAHYDVWNIKSDNANDNSASVFNLIALKSICPRANVVLVDGEEPAFFGKGSTRLAENLINTKYSKIKVINLDITGIGKDILVSNYSNGELSRNFVNIVDATVYSFPFNDAISFKTVNPNIECECVVLANKTENGIDTRHFGDIHSSRDSVDKLEINNMHNLVTKLETIYKMYDK